MPSSTPQVKTTNLRRVAMEPTKYLVERGVQTQTLPPVGSDQDPTISDLGSVRPGTRHSATTSRATEPGDDNEPSAGTETRTGTSPTPLPNPTSATTATIPMSGTTVDYAALVKPLTDFVTSDSHRPAAAAPVDPGSNNNGVRQILDCLANGNDSDGGSGELLNLIVNECDLIYECRTCRSLHRALPNFLAHKRFYCTQLYGDRGQRMIDVGTETRLNHANWAAFLRSNQGGGGTGGGTKLFRRAGGAGGSALVRGQATTATKATRSFFKRHQGYDEPSTVGWPTLPMPTVPAVEIGKSEEMADSEAGSKILPFGIGRNKRKTCLPVSLSTKAMVNNKGATEGNSRHVDGNQGASGIPAFDPEFKDQPQKTSLGIATLSKDTAGIVALTYHHPDPTPPVPGKGSHDDKDVQLATVNVKCEQSLHKKCPTGSQTVSDEPARVLFTTVPAVQLSPLLKCLDCSHTVTYPSPQLFVEHLSTEHSPDGHAVKCPLCPRYMLNLASLACHITMFHHKDGLPDIMKVMRGGPKGNLIIRPRSSQGPTGTKYGAYHKRRALSITSTVNADTDNGRRNLLDRIAAPTPLKLTGKSKRAIKQRGRPSLQRMDQQGGSGSGTTWTSKYGKGPKCPNINQATNPGCPKCGKQFKNLKIKRRHALFCQPTILPPAPSSLALTSAAPADPLANSKIPPNDSSIYQQKSLTPSSSSGDKRQASIRPNRFTPPPFTNVQKAKVLDLLSDPTFRQKSAADVFHSANQGYISTYYDGVGLECKLCDRRFNNPYTMYRHMFRHFDIFRFKCQICDMGSYDKCEIYTHIIDSHVPVPLNKKECRRAILDIRFVPIWQQRCSNAASASNPIPSPPTTKNITPSASSSPSIHPIVPTVRSQGSNGNHKKGLRPIIPTTGTSSIGKAVPHPPEPDRSTIPKKIRLVAQEYKESQSVSTIVEPRTTRKDSDTYHTMNGEVVLTAGRITSPIAIPDAGKTVGRPLGVKRKAGRPPSSRLTTRRLSNSLPLVDARSTAHASGRSPTPSSLTYGNATVKSEPCTDDDVQSDGQASATHSEELVTTATAGGGASKFLKDATAIDSLGAAARKKFESALAKAATGPPPNTASPRPISCVSPRRRQPAADACPQSIETSSGTAVNRDGPRYTTIRILSGGKVMTTSPQTTGGDLNYESPAGRLPRLVFQAPPSPLVTAPPLTPKVSRGGPSGQETRTNGDV